MLQVKADLHIHTVLSPCADVEMSPRNIVNEAINKGLNIIGITDHNSTRQCSIIKKIASDKGLFVMQGAEITSREEVHCLTFFEDDSSLKMFQQYIEAKQPKIKYNPKLFGYQVVVDENDNVLDQLDYYLGVGLDAGVDEIEEVVHQLKGLFIPAHINRARYSLISQLGFVPEDINADALEIFNRTALGDFLNQNKGLEKFSFLKDSDSHFVQSVGTYFSNFSLEEISFNEIRKALAGKDGRKVWVD
jgi:PHP family Zn ribbon phosphoesterase